MSWVSIDLKGKWYYVLYPRPVVVVSARYGNSESALAASWCMPVSLNPPLVAVSVAPTRYTYDLIVSSGEFAINILDYKYYREVSYLGTVSGRSVSNKIEKAGLTRVQAKKIKAPVIGEATAVLECKLHSKLATGDHVVIVGEVVEVYARKPLQSIPDIKKYKPLLQVAGLTYTTCKDETVKV